MNGIPFGSGNETMELAHKLFKEHKYDQVESDATEEKSLREQLIAIKPIEIEETETVAATEPVDAQAE